MVPGVSAAAEIDAIKSVEIVGDPGVPIEDQQLFRVKAFWELPASPQAKDKDTITLHFPQPVMAGWASTFVLEDAAGEDVGTCVVEVENITCTLNDYVETHSDIGGELWFQAQARQTTEEDSLTLVTGNDTVVPLPLPGGGIVPRTDPEPVDVEKWGWVSQDGTEFLWRIFVQASVLQPGADGLPVEIKDTLDVALTRTDLKVGWISNWNNGDYTPHTTWLGTDGFTRSDAGNVMTLAVNAPVRTTGLYVIHYSSPVPAGTEPGDIFSNKVEAKDVVPRIITVQVADAGGSASGRPKKSISITKQVKGTAPADFLYAFTVSCTKDGQAGYEQSGEVLADATVVFPRIPVGSVCVITETTTGGAVMTLQPAGPVAVTADSPATIEVVAVNDFSTPSSSSSPSSSSPSSSSPSSSGPSSSNPTSTSVPTSPSTSSSSPSESISVGSTSLSSPSSSPTSSSVVVASTNATTVPTRVTTTTAPRGPLPNTGVSVGPLLLGGAALILGGLVLSITRGRRAEHS